MDKKWEDWWVYDIETLSNFYSYTALNVITLEIVKFVIHESRNDLNALKTHLNSVKGHIGFNNVSFDAQVNQFIQNTSPSAEEIYNYSQKVISTSNSGGFGEYPEWVLNPPQIDLFKIKHFDNKAKMQSLKGLEFWMCYPNVQDMPINHKDFVNEDQIDDILEYNLNDVMATYEFFKQVLPDIELRQSLSLEFNLNLLNANDPKIGSEIFLKFLSEDMGVNKKELKQLRTYRDSIVFKDIILDYVSFKGKEFNTLLNDLLDTTITETKGSLEHSVVYKGFKYDYGAGGIHGCIKPGVYEADDLYDIRDIDVASFYPNLAIVNGFKPEHLGEAFNRIYKNIFETRKGISKKDARNAAYKLMLNGVYGKSNSKYSYLYDPKFTMSITINGQLLISMLAEELANCGYEILQVNTDGITIKHLKSESKNIDCICDKWSILTNLELETAFYSKMIIMDVNNYLSVKLNGDTKPKGLFEIIKEPHKDTSFTVVPYAISEYFTKGIPIENTIKSHTNIYDFCGRAKFKGNDYGEIRYISNYNEVKEKQQKTTRYFISNKGATFIKMYAKGSEEFINKGYQVTIFNKYYKKENYDINYDFYIKECNKIINSIEIKQLSLF